MKRPCCIIKHKEVMRLCSRKIGWSVACLVLFVFLAPVAVLAGVGNTKHNLSVSGPGPAKATSETRVCVFCHTPHNSSPEAPLWNHELSSVRNYVNYWSPTLKSYTSPEEAPPIDGFSKLCLSCHDGTVALGAVLNPEGMIQTIPEKLVFGMEGYLGTDLSGGHPISIVFDEALVNLRNADSSLLQLNWPITDNYVKLYPTQGGRGVQCTSCHDPHGGRGEAGAPPFWQKTTYDAVCEVCHNAAPPGIGH